MKMTRIYCFDCFADTVEECICNRIEGYDAEIGYPIVSITEEELEYLYSDVNSSSTTSDKVDAGKLKGG